MQQTCPQIMSSKPTLAELSPKLIAVLSLAYLCTRFIWKWRLNSREEVPKRLPRWQRSPDYSEFNNLKHGQTTFPLTGEVRNPQSCERAIDSLGLSSREFECLGSRGCRFSPGATPCVRHLQQSPNGGKQALSGHFRFPSTRFGGESKVPEWMTRGGDGNRTRDKIQLPRTRLISSTNRTLRQTLSLAAL
jgi:hypothetical protein